ncbi:MAG: type II toxin-antitoxin system HipA family toxin [Candidatus Methanoplasma sp.]|jgi:serine/threonine-protein kinase HipA|nr:type II toxin-antitoxin system HipA family toxin [Candidatus Methanoplasma sp.]
MESERITQIRLWGRTAGYAWWDRKEQCAVFQYDPEFIKKGYDIAPLTMPLTSRPYRFGSLARETFQGLPGTLSDSLPDSYGNALIDLWIAENNYRKADLTPLDRLCYVGKRGIGALEYEPAAGRSYNGRIDVNKLSALAADVLCKREEMDLYLTRDGLQELLSVGTSAGGARAKAVIGVNGAGEIHSGQTDLPDGYSHWLIKFDAESDGPEKKEYCRTEYAYYEMARDCEIEMTECRLLEIDTKAHFMTRRFDRIGNEKIHSQTLCAMAHYDFKVPGAYPYESMLSIMRRLRMPYPDQEQAFRRMVFNVVMRNQDDHTKNFSFLLRENGGWRLSPAYDITYAFDPTNYWTQRHQMSVNGKLLDITRKDLTEFAQNMNIKNAEDIIDATVSAALEWRSYARSSGVPERTAEKIDKVLLKGI